MFTFLSGKHKSQACFGPLLASVARCKRQFRFLSKVEVTVYGIPVYTKIKQKVRKVASIPFSWDAPLAFCAVWSNIMRSVFFYNAKTLTTKIPLAEFQFTNCSRAMARWGLSKKNSVPRPRTRSQLCLGNRSTP